MYPVVTVPVDAAYLAEVNGFDGNGRSDHGDGYSYGPIEDRPGHEIYIKGGDALDVYNPAGTEIHAGITGVVIEIGIDRYGTYFIIIEGPEGKTVDAHLNGPTVDWGYAVEAGQVIGYISDKLDYPHDHAERFINGRSLMAAEILANITGGGDVATIADLVKWNQDRMDNIRDANNRINELYGYNRDRMDNNEARYGEIKALQEQNARQQEEIDALKAAAGGVPNGSIDIEAIANLVADRVADKVIEKIKARL